MTEGGIGPERFQRFAAIDWSGAKGSRHRGIAIAMCGAGDARPRLIRRKRPWSRTEVLAWMLLEARKAPTLFGMDFSFAPPITERGNYLPGELSLPRDARSFWAYVDARCDDADLGAASFLEQHHRRHFYFGVADGRKSDYLFHRVCETAFSASGGGKASTVYDAIGAAQVAKASFAGMRFLHRLGDRLPIWPFDPLPGHGSVLVEIYTRLFIRLAGFSGRKIRDPADLDAALIALGSKPLRARRPLTDHETDVLIAAAGLRRLAGQAAIWQPQGLTPALARTEGWTFGVT